MSTIIDLMLAIRREQPIYYHKDTKRFDRFPFTQIEGEEIDFDELISINDTDNIRLPSYSEINHKEIMRFYVRECVPNKEIRKQLFDILRRYEYIDAYIEKLHELNLYDDFTDVCEDIYIQILKEWSDENDLDIMNN